MTEASQRPVETAFQRLRFIAEHTASLYVEITTEELRALLAERDAARARAEEAERLLMNGAGTLHLVVLLLNDEGFHNKAAQVQELVDGFRHHLFKQGVIKAGDYLTPAAGTET